MTAVSDRMNWYFQHRVCILGGPAFAPGETVCPSCDHAVLAHIGTPACVVCEMRGELADLRAARNTGG